MIVINIKGVKISVDIGFLAVIAIIMLSGRESIAYAFLSCIIHETGHLINIIFAKEKIKEVAFNITGVKICLLNNRINSFFSDICIMLGGSFANIITAVLTILSGKALMFAMINLILGIFNLLPFSKLDGGSVIYLIADYCECEKIKKYLPFFNIIFLLILILIFREYIIINITLAVMIAYLIYMEIVSLK